MRLRRGECRLERTFNERLKLLAPATGRGCRQIWTPSAVPMKTCARHGEGPCEPTAAQLLHSTWQQEIDLYTNVAQSTEPF
jgi:hypothetical protein